MNIFYLDSNPVKAAQMMCDKHVIKMPLETAQLLCNAFPRGTTPYKNTHESHPCSIWVKKSRANFEWLIAHGFALCKEYTYRYEREHKSANVIQWCKERIDQIQFKFEGFTEPPQCLPDEFKCDYTELAYQNYYLNDKFDMAVWTKREIPKFFVSFLTPSEAEIKHRKDYNRYRPQTKQERLKTAYSKLKINPLRTVYPVFITKADVYSEKLQKRRHWFTKCLKCGLKSFVRECCLKRGNDCMCSTNLKSELIFKKKQRGEYVKG